MRNRALEPGDDAFPNAAPTRRVRDSKAYPMGKLKTSLAGFATLIDSISEGGRVVVEELSSKATNVKEIVGRVNGGYELLAMYLKQKALAAKQDIKTWNAQTIKDHPDSEVAGFVKNIEAARADALTAFKNYEAVRDGKAKAVTADIDRAIAVIDEIKATIDKKRKRLFQSTKFKTKIAGYEQTLNALGTKVKTMRVDFTGEVQSSQSSGPIKLAGLKITPATTVAQVFAHASYGLKDELQKIAGAKRGELGKRFQAYATEIKQIRSWVAEADEMEAEADAGEVVAKPEAKPEPKPDPKPGVNKIVIKMGSTEIGTAVKGEYDRATKLLTCPVVVWKVKGTDPLDYLQKKMTLSGSYENAAEGKFANEMKLDKLAGDMKKATFKGA